MFRACVRRLAALDTKAVEATLMQCPELRPEFCTVKDVSGGCGSFIEVNVESFAFNGKSILQQHRMVTKTLKDLIPGLHGLTIKTTASKRGGSAFHRDPEPEPKGSEKK